LASRKHDCRTLLALAAAFVLLLQTFATAWAAGAMPAGPALDAFGNPLCIAGHATVPADGPVVPAHGTVADCCSFACGASGALASMPASGSATLMVPPRAAGARAPAGFEAPAGASGYEPGNPRAPPVTA
jgi:hypothetical protein